MNTIILSPAYGRDYKNKAAAIADFEAGRDFLVESIGPFTGRYATKQDIVKVGRFTHAELRYRRLTQLALVKIA